MMYKAFCTKNLFLALDLEKELQTNPVLTENDAKRIFQQNRRFRTRFRETVITYAVSTQNEWKTHFGPKRRLALDLEKQFKLTQF